MNDELDASEYVLMQRMTEQKALLDTLKHEYEETKKNLELVRENIARKIEVDKQAQLIVDLTEKYSSIINQSGFNVLRTKLSGNLHCGVGLEVTAIDIHISNDYIVRVYLEREGRESGVLMGHGLQISFYNMQPAEFADLKFLQWSEKEDRFIIAAQISPR